MEMRIKFIGLFIALALSAAFFYAVRPYGFQNGTGNSYSFAAFTAGINGVQSGPYQRLLWVWKPRVGSMWLSAGLLKWFKPAVMEVMTESVSQTNLYTGFYSTNEARGEVMGVSGVKTFGKLEGAGYLDLYAAFNTAWFFGVLCLLLLFLEEPIFPMLATLAGMLYSLSVTCNSPLIAAVDRLPWDVPSVFFFTWAFLLFRGRYYWPMVGVIILGTLFKETVAVTALLFFFRGNSIREQIRCFTVAFIGCLAVRLVVTHFVYGHVSIFTAEHHAAGHLWASMKHFLGWELHPHLNWFGWLGGGLFVSVFFLPVSSTEDIGVLCVVAVMFLCLVATNILDGAAIEIREYLDIVPMLAVVFQNKLYPQIMQMGSDFK